MLSQAFVLLFVGQWHDPDAVARVDRSFATDGGVEALRLLSRAPRPTLQEREFDRLREVLVNLMNVDGQRPSPLRPPPPVPSGRIDGGEGGGASVFVAASALAVRRAPAVTAEVIASLPINAEVHLISSANGWSKIRPATPFPPKQQWARLADGGMTLTEEPAPVEGFVGTAFIDVEPQSPEKLIALAKQFEAQGQLEIGTVYAERAARLTGSRELQHTWLAMAWKAKALESAGSALLAIAALDNVAGFSVERIERTEWCKGSNFATRFIALESEVVPNIAGPACIIAKPTWCPFCDSPSAMYTPEERAAEMARAKAGMAAAGRLSLSLVRRGFARGGTTRVFLRNRGKKTINKGTTFFVFTHQHEGQAIEEAVEHIEIRTPRDVLPNQAVDLSLDLGFFFDEVGVSDGAQDKAHSSRSIKRDSALSECGCD